MSRYLAVLFSGLLIVGCDDDAPTAPSQTASGGRIVIGAITPGTGGSVISTGAVPGAMIARGSGQVAIPLTITAGRELPWAQLNVYLLTADGTYCGQNLPDSPTWGPFRATDSVAVTISGFQVYRLPCVVTGVRAMLHTRNNGLLLPPISSETAAEATANASFTIR